MFGFRNFTPVDDLCMVVNSFYKLRLIWSEIQFLYGDWLVVGNQLSL